MTASLTPKQARFVAEYLVDLNATQAAIRAGYSARTANRQGHRLLTNADIQAAVEKGRQRVATKLEVTQERVIGELAKLAFVNPRSFLRITPDGEPAIDLTRLTDDEAAALTEFSVEDFTDGRGDDKRDVRRVRLKWADKGANLERLGRHLGLFKDKVEVQHSVQDREALVAEAKALGVPVDFVFAARGIAMGHDTAETPEADGHGRPGESG